MADMFCVALGAMAAYRGLGSMAGWSAWPSAFAGMVTCLGALMMPAFGVYQSWRGRSMTELVFRLTLGWSSALLAGYALALLFHRANDEPAAWYVGWYGLSWVSMVVLRMVAYGIMRALRSRGFDTRYVAIVGCNEHGRSLIERLQTHANAGWVPVCVFDARAVSGAAASGLPVYNSLPAFARRVRQQRVKELWLALPMHEERAIGDVLREFEHDFVNIRFLPNVRNLVPKSAQVSELLGAPAINLVASPGSGEAVFFKAVFDRLFSAAALICLSPLMLLIALAIKATSPGPVFFRQTRKGIDGREFQIYKFRSMVVHAEAAGTVTQARRNDARITPLGRFLRRTSLDELPQFINVMRGEMSVVGPRPHAVQHDDQYKSLLKGYMLRYRVKPGITGWAQVNGCRGETEQVQKMADRLYFDLYYMQHWSLWLDMRIVWMTLCKGFTGANAY
ncbi:undecaprenyl-phosphate glucose phosphotransferase [Cupriavidus pauculus]|nr:undecaprenyl-phosphate glucose phosphotransferase [Cupriavidus pauculus]